MIHVGLTGGVASGKSAVAAQLAKLGAVVIDADKLAREVVAPGTDGLAQIRQAFGQAVFSPDGSLDRAALGALVFSDEAQRLTLNAIVHPLVRAEANRLRAAAANEAVVVEDIHCSSNLGKRIVLIRFWWCRHHPKSGFAGWLKTGDGAWPRPNLGWPRRPVTRIARRSPIIC